MLDAVRGNQQICSEGIEMTADAANLGEVAQLLLPLIVPDLPVVLWCRGIAILFDAVFRSAVSAGAQDRGRFGDGEEP